MRLKSIVKYNISSIKSALMIYYSIFIAVCVSLILISENSNESISSSGLEISSVIFIFIAGLNLFKENFFFMKSNNVTRKEFLYGAAIPMIPVVLLMSIADIVINRIYNLFIKSPTNYDMIYTSLRNEKWFLSTNWVQSNSIETLFNTFMFQVTVYLAFFSFGFLVTIIYYKCNKFMKIVVSIFPIMLFNLIGIIRMFYPNFMINMNKFIEVIFGLNNQNIYAAISTFIAIFIILIGIARLLTRKAIIKQL